MVQKMVGLRRFIIVLGFLLFTPLTLLAQDKAPESDEEMCFELLTRDAWFKIVFHDDEGVKAAFINSLEVCGTNYGPPYQKHVDEQAVSLLQAAGNVTDDQSQKVLVRFVTNIFSANAKAGYANSFHNLAALFNAPKGSPAWKHTEQNHDTFIYFTRLAAAYGNQAALFNLAMNLGAAKPIKSVKRDFKTAYIILHNLKKGTDSGEFTPPEEMAAHTDQALARLKDKFKADEVAALEKRAKTFDYTKLAPPKK